MYNSPLLPQFMWNAFCQEGFILQYVTHLTTELGFVAFLFLEGLGAEVAT